MSTLNAGQEWAELRARLRLSRERFAQEAGLTPGAVWRIEAKGVLKPGELEKLEAVRQRADVPASALPEVTVFPPAAIAVPTPTVTPQDELVDTPQPSPLLGVAEPLLTTTLPAEPEVVNAPELSPWQLSQQDGVYRYSNSEIQTFKRCRRKWYLAYYLRYRLRDESPVGARAIGDRLHRALRWHYHPDPKLRRDVRDALEIIIKMDHAALRQRYAPDVIPLSLETKFTQEADLERIMVAGYVEWLEETGADAELIVTGAEEYVEVDLPNALEVVGKPIKLVGRLDARVRRTSDNARLLIDHKSVGNFDGPTRLLVLHEQMKMYIALERLLAAESGDRADGAIFNMMRRVKRTAKANPPFYQRVEVRHNPIAVGNFITQLGGVISEIERVRRALDEGADHRLVAFPTPNSDCTWSCDFLPLDSLMDDGSYWERMAEAFYQIGDPSAYYVKNNVLKPV